MLVVNYNIDKNINKWQEEQGAIREQLGLKESSAIPRTHLWGLTTWVEAGATKAIAAIFKNVALGEEVLQLGAFDCVDKKSGEEFLRALIKLLKAEGAKIVVGPMLGSTWHPYTFQIQGDVILPTEQIHPDWYPKLWQKIGFTMDKEFYHFALGNIPEINVEKQLTKLSEQGISIKSKLAYTSEELVSKLYSFLHVSFGKAYLFSPIDWQEFKKLFTPLCDAKHQGLLWVAEKKDKIVAMVFGMQGAPKTFIMKTLARHPHPEYQRLGKIIGLHFMQECKKMGAEKLVFANAREGNFSVFRAKEQGAQKVNTRSLFKLKLS